jgi:hypothetical protein
LGGEFQTVVESLRLSNRSEKRMSAMRFLTVGYGDQAGYDRTPPDLRDAAHDHDARQAAAGAITGVLLEPIQVRNHQARGLTTQAGPFSTSDLPVAGFSLIEADSLEEAIAIAAQAPCAVADGVVEVWPVR